MTLCSYEIVAARERVLVWISSSPCVPVVEIISEGLLQRTDDSFEVVIFSSSGEAPADSCEHSCLAVALEESLAALSLAGRTTDVLFQPLPAAAEVAAAIYYAAWQNRSLYSKKGCPHPQNCDCCWMSMTSSEYS